jgi:hypothetical protein
MMFRTAVAKPYPGSWVSRTLPLSWGVPNPTNYESRKGRSRLNKGTSLSCSIVHFRISREVVRNLAMLLAIRLASSIVRTLAMSASALVSRP